MAKEMVGLREGVRSCVGASEMAFNYFLIKSGLRIIMQINIALAAVYISSNIASYNIL